MESRVLKPILAVYVGLFILFLYGPFIVLAILSFQQGPEGGPQFPIIEWSTYWYRHHFRPDAAVARRAAAVRRVAGPLAHPGFHDHGDLDGARRDCRPRHSARDSRARASSSI